MTVCVFTKAKGESIYRNVKHISTGARMEGGKPLYTISLHQENRTDVIDLENITGFEVHQAKLTWIEDRTNLICPHCGYEFSDEIRFMGHGEDLALNYCPVCGKEIDDPKR